MCWLLQVVPFFFYRGLECLTYSWSDRAFQALFTAVYAGQFSVTGWWWWWDRHHGTMSVVIQALLNAWKQCIVC